MTRHTEGPWMVERAGEKAFEVNSSPNDGGPWSAVANVEANCNGSRNITAAEAKANAHLIAAAPDMLGELLVFEETWRDGRTVTIEPGTVWAARIEKVLAAAKGGVA